MLKKVILLCTVLIMAASQTTFAQDNKQQLAKLAEGNTRFGFKLYHAMAGQSQENVVYSPYSISQAFAMVYAGANGNTAQEMSKVLEFSVPQAEISTTFKALNDDMLTRGNHVPKGNNDPMDVPRALKV